MAKWDFSGWATRNNMKCSDGRVIRQDAFKVNNGKKVPLVYNHIHDDPDMILGHAMLENRKDGVYAYCKLNNSQKANSIKEALKNEDVSSLSIWANNLVQDGSDVLHGVIRELSVVLAGANPGAYIESVLQHGIPMDEDDDEAIIYTGEPISVSDLYISHAEEDDKMENNKKRNNEGADNQDEKTFKDVLDTLTEEQKKVVYGLIGSIIEDYGIEDYDGEEDEEDMRHNLFENDYEEGGYLSHAEQKAAEQELLHDAVKYGGSLKEFIKASIDDGVLSHADIDITGMTGPTGTQNYGFRDPEMLFPEYRNVNGATPEWLSRDMGWVRRFMSGVGRTPFSRIKSVFANITEDEARARGYIKGKMKKEEVFTLLKRTTGPQTIYKKQKLDRDDIIDIVDFDVVAWIRAEMRAMLDEEIARACLIGDGRQSDSDDKIQEIYVRPIAKDVPLFNIKRDVNVATGASEDEIAKAVIRAALKARKDYKGSGNPILFTTEDYLTDMLLLEDGIGHRLYKTEQELATALRVSGIETVEPMENQTIDGKKLIGVIVNLSDYKIGADKGGQISMFDDFDIDYNQQKYLIETRISGALVKPFSAITLLLNPAASRSAAEL